VLDLLLDLRTGEIFLEGAADASSSSDSESDVKVGFFLESSSFVFFFFDSANNSYKENRIKIINNKYFLPTFSLPFVREWCQVNLTVSSVMSLNESYRVHVRARIIAIITV